MIIKSDYRLLNFKNLQNIFDRDPKDTEKDESIQPSISALNDISEIQPIPNDEMYEMKKIEILEVIKIDKKKKMISLKLQVQDLFIYVAQVLFDQRKFFSLTRVHNNAESIGIAIQRIFFKKVYSSIIEIFIFYIYKNRGEFFLFELNKIEYAKILNFKK